MIDTKALRSRVLDLAIQGKLTEQLESDGTAEELWQKIQAEKQRLIKEGKLKKEKPLPEIIPDEIPFEIPENWKWVRMGAVYSFNPAVEANDNTDAAFIPMERISAGFCRDFSFQVQKWEAASKNHTRFSDGDVAFAKITPCFENRKSFVAEGLPNTIGGGTTELIILRQPFIFSYYTYLLIIQQRFIDVGVSTYKGTAGQQRVKNDALKQYLIPLPPLAEQKRIVARVEEIFRLLDIIDSAQEQYAADAESLKAKLITLGIQGRLTEQLASDGTAEELYQQIQAEKQRLIKEGKIKREKPLPEISEEEIPFEIPENWKWVRFGELYSLSNGLASRGSQGGRERPVLRLADIANGSINTDNIRKIALTEVEYSSHIIQKNDLVIIRVNGSKDKVATVYPYDSDEEISYCDHLFCAKCLSSLLEITFVSYVFNSAEIRKLISPSIKTTAGQNTISQKNIGIIPIPLPPLAEQKRIAETLERVLGVLG